MEKLEALGINRGDIKKAKDAGALRWGCRLLLPWSTHLRCCRLRLDGATQMHLAWSHALQDTTPASRC